MNQSDLLLAIPVVEGGYHHWQPDVVFSESLHQGYWLLVQRGKDDVAVEPPYDGVTLGMFNRIAYHEEFADLPKVSVNSALSYFVCWFLGE